ncbi:hypothetical protein P9J64_05930 [Deltaproteobacteria bacterium IMCC39524]|nr:hypothetical protein [Deltaproteobacteria bacterium IMCC39524]
MREVKREKPIVKRLNALSALMLNYNLEVEFGTGCQFASLNGCTTGIDPDEFSEQCYDKKKGGGSLLSTRDPEYLSEQDTRELNIETLPQLIRHAKDISKAMGLKSFTSDPAYLTSIEGKRRPRVRKTLNFAMDSPSLPFPTLPQKFSRRTGKFMAGIGGKSE